MHRRSSNTHGLNIDANALFRRKDDNSQLTTHNSQLTTVRAMAMARSWSKISVLIPSAMVTSAEGCAERAASKVAINKV